MKLFFKLLLCFFAFLLTLLGCIGYANHLISDAAKGKTFDESALLPATKVGLLLGTSKTLKNGRINLYFKYRVEAAARLMHENKISCLIISGDNSTKEYDEPTDMKLELIKRGIDSTRIHLDYAGFRTFDSIVRAKEIFGQQELTFISQKFHNERALFIAEKLGIKAYGFNAQDVEKAYGFKTALREKLARVKVLLDFLWGTKPKFLGEKIPIC
jgi:SanA protein